MRAAGRATQGILLSLALSLLAAPAAPATDAMQQTEVFSAGADGYHTYRIPALICTAKGTLLAFAEGRAGGAGDSGNIDLVLKRSSDHGCTWQAMQVVADDGPNTFGNPCPVVDQRTGAIWLLLTHNLGKDTEARIMDQTSAGTRTVWICQSTDDGRTWSAPREITSQVKATNWTWYATGPGVGIQMRTGRLVIPGNHALAASKVMRSHIIYSDNGGASWNMGGVSGAHCNESQVAELRNGSLLLNMRSYHGKNQRAIARSSDGGLTWSEPSLDPALVEPVCQASLIRYPLAEKNGGSCLLFSNPSSTRREKMTVRASCDDGKSWPIARTLHSGPAAYSCLAQLPDQSIGCLYERGDQKPYEKITFARFTFAWLGAGLPP